ARHDPVTTTAASSPRTTPKQAVATKPTTTPQRSRWRTFSDDFSESAPRWTMWNVDTEGAGATWTLESGQLELALLASGGHRGRASRHANRRAREELLPRPRRLGAGELRAGGRPGDARSSAVLTGRGLAAEGDKSRVRQLHRLCAVDDLPLTRS